MITDCPANHSVPITMLKCCLHSDTNEMNGVLGHDYALKGYTGLGITYANEMITGMNHAPGAGLIARPDDLMTCSQHATTVLRLLPWPSDIFLLKHVIFINPSVSLQPRSDWVISCQ